MASVSVKENTLHYDTTSLVCEQNTFVTVVVAPACWAPPCRSTRSVPPSMKLARSNLASFGKLAHDALKPMLPRAQSLAEVSTLAGSSVACTSDTSSDAGRGSLLEEDSQSSVCERDPVSIVLCDLVQPPAAPPRQKLSTKAKAFVSSSAKQTGKQLHIRSVIDSVLPAVQAAVAAVGIVLQISVVSGLNDFSVVANIPPQSAEKKGLVLAAAQEALLQAAERSSSTFCLGYAAKPFAPTPDGFSARLAHMGSEQSACWDMLSTGVCRRGCYCHWEHPQSVVTMNMSVVVADSA